MINYSINNNFSHHYKKPPHILMKKKHKKTLPGKKSTKKKTLAGRTVIGFIFSYICILNRVSRSEKGKTMGFQHDMGKKHLMPSKVRLKFFYRMFSHEIIRVPTFLQPQNSRIFQGIWRHFPGIFLHWQLIYSCSFKKKFAQCHFSYIK